MWIYRSQAAVTFAELADRLCVSRQTLWSIERDRSIPSVTLAIAIARELDATVEDIFGDDWFR